MSFDPPLAEDIEAGDVTDETLWEKVRSSLVFLFGVSAGATSTDIPNGNMEIDSDSDGIPDFWTEDGSTSPIYGGNAVVYPGGTVELDTAAPLDGAQSIKMVHPGGAGNGGGLLESDFISCGFYNSFFIGFLHKSSASGMKNTVLIYWYDEDQVTLGGGVGSAFDVLYNSVKNPTAQTYYLCHANPPANAKFFTIGAIGGFTDTDVAGTAYFDSFTKTSSAIGSRRGGLFSVAESTTTSTSFVTIGSSTINIPYKNVPVAIAMDIQCKSAAGTATVKMVVGSTSSTEVTSTSAAYGSEVGNPATITLAAAEASADGADFTILLSAKNSAAATTTAAIISNNPRTLISNDSLTL